MRRTFSEYIQSGNVTPRNWEEGVREVTIESCDRADDPMGYRAVFYLRHESARAEARKSFVVGASFLEARKVQISKAGYDAPMTQKAIGMVQKKVQKPLSSLCENA